VVVLSETMVLFEPSPAVIESAVRTEPSTLLVVGLTVGLAVVHALPRWVQLFDEEGIRWLSAASGITIAFVFIEILPSIQELSDVAIEEGSNLLATIGSHIYVVVLLGFVAYHGIETMATTRTSSDGEDIDLMFWTHIGAFSLYNFIVGYKLSHLHFFGEPSYIPLFFCSLAVHFMVTDYGLQSHYGARYDRIGRWVVIAAILIGSGVGLGVDINADIAILAAFLAGGIIFNAINNEIESPSRTQFSLLIAFVVGYGALLIIM